MSASLHAFFSLLFQLGKDIIIRSGTALKVCLQLFSLQFLAFFQEFFQGESIVMQIFLLFFDQVSFGGGTSLGRANCLGGVAPCRGKPDLNLFVITNLKADCNF